ncbi:MAG: UDP-N-acetylmuramate--L-alanine ligase [Candidatus Woesebacteria bacterium]
MNTLFEAKNIHLVGIKGVAMASLAQCLDDIGITLTGSDVKEDFVTKEVLSQRGIVISTGFAPGNVPTSCDLLVYTGAHQGKQNAEVQEAIRRGIRVMSHAEALGELMRGKKGISVCGTGGKSTTSAMLAWTLDSAGMRPSFSVGVGKVNNFGVSGRYTQIHSQETDEISKSGWFVAEADEYAVDPTEDHRPRFIYQLPGIIVCTNLNYDHPDIYPTFEMMKETFLAFFNTLEDGELLVLNGDCEALLSLIPKIKKGVHVVTVGKNKNCTMQVDSIKLSLQVPGNHNRQNALFAYAVGKALQIDSEKILQALASYTGTMRRFEPKGKINGISYYDDYAHTPDEITATIQALREREPGKKTVVAFQPHTYSRTKALFDGFVASLSLADEVFILDIFASARESEDLSVSSQMLVEAIGEKAKLVPTIEDLRIVFQTVTAECVCITMGAGDIYKVYEHMQVDK